MIHKLFVLVFVNFYFYTPGRGVGFRELVNTPERELVNTPKRRFGFRELVNTPERGVGYS